MTEGTRSLERGLALLEALARHEAMSLADLHRETGLAKSTIRRLLFSLTDRRFVRRSLSDGRYRISVTLPDFAGEPVPRHMAQIADAAMPHALALTRRIGWPSDVHVRDGPAMRIIDSTRGTSPFHLYQGKVNRRISHFGAATGMACLAAAAPAEVDALHQQTINDQTWGLCRFSLDITRYHCLLAEVRKRGYGARLATYLGETILDDELLAMAVPICLNGTPLGALSIIWPRAFKSVETFAPAHLDPLREAVAATEADLARITKA